ncbi:MAG: carbohydrate ABC transporter permease [Kiritimatiellia bacterium]
MVILPVERRTFRARLILGTLYLLLAIGAMTMVWPFLIMVTGSMTNRFDYHRYSPVLRSLWNDEDRLMRVLASYHASFPQEIFPEAPSHWNHWTAIARDPVAVKRFAEPWLKGLADPSTLRTWTIMANDYAEFNATYTVTNSICSFDEREIAPYVQSVFEARTGYRGRDAALAELNRTWKIRYSSFYGIRMRAQQRVPLHYPDWDWATDDPKTELWQEFKAHCREVDIVQMPYTRTRPYLIAPLWNQWRAKKGLPAETLFPGKSSDPHWRAFVHEAYPKRLLRITVNENTRALWTAYLSRQCKTPADYARLMNCAAPASLADVPLYAYENSLLWRGFVGTVPFAYVTATSPEADWQAFLQKRYGTLARLAESYGWTATDWRAVKLPMAQAFMVTYEHCGRRLLLKDVTANYRTVNDVLFLRGRAFTNTLILVFLTILATLTVNPLAAYALSRFNLRCTEGILLFLLSTMAFPAAVTAIPGFLLIRELGLLNTFAALVLPTVANGLSIFILKGFFDGLPRELYEAATIDGASEWQIFRHITLPMTTPILAVNALNAFVAAYNSWEWALLVCQKQSHWTLSVWMYQLSQQFAGSPWVVMAGFVIISIPTAIVFLLCQRVIMRGIVLPSMK